MAALGGSVSSPEDFVILNPPANDLFGAAQPIAGNSGSVSASNMDAGVEPGEPSHAGQLGGRSIWYRWVAPTNGAWVFDTRGSTVDTLLAVYTGSSVSNLTLVATNDDSGAEITSSVAFNAIAGQEYRIVVVGVSVDVVAVVDVGQDVERRSGRWSGVFTEEQKQEQTEELSVGG